MRAFSITDSMFSRMTHVMRMQWWRNSKAESGRVADVVEAARAVVDGGDMTQVLILAEALNRLDRPEAPSTSDRDGV